MICNSAAAGCCQRAPWIRSAALTAVVVVWAGGVAAGGGALWRHALTPGPAVPAPATWPPESTLSRSPDRSTLVMFVHPRCPCTRASLRELERLLAAGHERLDAVIAFVEPQGMSPDWTESDLWRSAVAMQGVTVVRDQGGDEAERFAAVTSGEVLVYDPDGRLSFQGGITSARGHEGDSEGQAAILSLARGETAARCSPSFGCPLWTPGSQPAGEKE
jgi:hypothetical protein